MSTDDRSSLFPGADELARTIRGGAAVLEPTYDRRASGLVLAAGQAFGVPRAPEAPEVPACAKRTVIRDAVDMDSILVR